MSYLASRVPKALAGLVVLAGLSLLVAGESLFGSIWVVESIPGPLVGQIGYWMGQGWVQASFLAAMLLAGKAMDLPAWNRGAVRGWVAFALSGLGSQAIKHLIGRPRPRLWAEGVSHFGPSLTSGLDSFPSGHTSTSFALAMVLAWYFPKAAPLWMILASLVAASRLISGAHYLSDVLGGMILGLFSGWMAIRLCAGPRFEADPCR